MINDVPDGGHSAYVDEYQSPKGTRELHALAYRARAGMIGRLALCICTWPIDVDASTWSNHSEFCPVERSYRDG